MKIEEGIAKNITNQEQIRLVIQEKIRNFDVTKNESRVYMHLHKFGSRKAIQISKEEKIPRTEIYRLLSSLKKKGMVQSINQKPSKFSARPIENALESAITYHQEKIKKISQEKPELIKMWIKICVPKNSEKNPQNSEPVLKKYASSGQLTEDFKNNFYKTRKRSIEFPFN